MARCRDALKLPRILIFLVLSSLARSALRFAPAAGFVRRFAFSGGAHSRLRAVAECRDDTIANAQPAIEAAIGKARHPSVEVLDAAALIISVK